MTYNWTYIFLILLIFITACSDSERQYEANDKNPNIVLIFADDLGIGDVGIYNQKSKIPTPNIDNLASQGMRFTDMHSAGKTCVPSRYGLLTGRYPMRTELNWREGSILNEDGLQTFGNILQANGYKTYMIGKWHLGFAYRNYWEDFDFSQSIPGGPLDHGFDEFFGIPASLDQPPYFFIDNSKAVQAPTDSIDANYTPGATANRQGASWAKGKIAPDFKHQEVLDKIRKRSLAYIDNHIQENNDTPFFAYISLTAPHIPWLPDEKFRGTSDAGTYGDFVVQVDALVGDIMEKVNDLGIDNNTLFIFTTDNGARWFEADKRKWGHYANHIYRGMKGDGWEGGHRVPFIARWPDYIAPGSISTALAGLTDLRATFQDIVNNGAIPDTLDSKSLLPVLTGDSPDNHRYHLIVENDVIRKGPWKLILGSGLGGIHRSNSYNIVNPPDKEGELYHLERDPEESNNLYYKNPKKVKELKQLLQRIEEKPI